MFQQSCNRLRRRSTRVSAITSPAPDRLGVQTTWTVEAAALSTTLGELMIADRKAKRLVAQAGRASGLPCVAVLRIISGRHTVVILVVASLAILVMRKGRMSRSCRFRLPSRHPSHPAMPALGHKLEKPGNWFSSIAHYRCPMCRQELLMTYEAKLALFEVYGAVTKKPKSRIQRPPSGLRNRRPSG